MKQFTCKECGKIVTLKFYERIRKFCCRKCWQRYYSRQYYRRNKDALREKRRLLAMQKPKPPTETKFCVMCGKTFETDAGAEFCGKFCKQWHKRYTAAKNKKLIYARFVKELEKRKE